MKKYIPLFLIAILLPAYALAGFWDFLKSNSQEQEQNLGAGVFRVIQGGTGASTLTGCLEGNGTSPITGTGVPCGTGSGGGGGDTNWTFSATQGGFIRLATTTNMVSMGSTTPYARLSVVSSAVASTTLALQAAASQTANILDIYLNRTLTNVIDSNAYLGLGTTTPGSILSIQSVGNFIF